VRQSLTALCGGKAVSAHDYPTLQDSLEPGRRHEYLQRLQKLLDGRSDKTVFIRAPGKMAYGDVVNVIDVAKSAGAQPIGLQVDQLE
jgi:biopolymer transport protein ExbD